MPLAFRLMLPGGSIEHASVGSPSRGGQSSCDDLAPVRDVRREAQRRDLRLDRDLGLRVAVDEEHRPRVARRRRAACRRAKWPSQASSSPSSAWAEKPLIERIWQRTARTWPSSLTSFAPAWRCAPERPLALVADEQDGRVRVVDEVAQVADDAPAGQHPVRGHDHVRPRRVGDRLRRLGRRRVTVWFG